MNKYFMSGCFVWGIFVLILFCLRPKSHLHDMTLENLDSKKKWMIIFSMAVTVFICTVPMSLSPTWNGENPAHRNQYELMAESILEGHLYIDHDVDPALLEMDNPYDPQARSEAGVTFCWDYAFYNGHWYMYFGIVPVFLLFLPYRIVTGTNLTSYHATQFFAGMFICGIFVLFYKLAKIFFKNISFSMYLMLACAFAMMSVWYSVDAPALYCTAITSGLCMEVWSLVFFMQAVFGEKESAGYAFLGSFLGALAFGCRPPAALANVLVLPLLAEYLREKTIEPKLIRQLAVAASPYLIIAGLLMAYNYIRFDNPFEFGQAYQMTIADQSHYGSFFQQFDFLKILNGILWAFISYRPFYKEFPYIFHNGAFINFPILLFSVFGLSQKEVRRNLKAKHILCFAGILFLMPIIIMTADILWTPSLGERYRMDIYWVMGILCYLIIGIYGSEVPDGLNKRKYSFITTVWALITACESILLFLVPFDENFTEYYPDVLEKIRRVFMLGID